MSSGECRLIGRFDNGAAQPNLAANSVAKYVTPLPPLPEQNAIVEILDRIFSDSQILQAIYKKKIADLARLKQSILAKAFAGELTNQPDRALAMAGA